MVQGALQEHDKKRQEDIGKENEKEMKLLLEVLEMAKLAGAVVMVSSEDQDMLHGGTIPVRSPVHAHAEGEGKSVSLRDLLMQCVLLDSQGCVFAKLLSAARLMTLVLLCCDHVVSP